ncbi:MAG: sugar-binding domain-containing protein [Bryobacteraceae bacterium]
MPRPRIVTAHTRQIAALLHADGKSNKEIGTRLNLSESAISKVIRDCYTEGLLSIRFRTEGLSAREIQILRAEAGLKNKLTERLRLVPKDTSAVVTEPDVMIIDSGSAQTTARGWTLRLDAFSKGASQEVMKLILRSGIVGVSWGRTLATVVRAMRELPPATAHTPIQFIPLCGEMLEGPPRKTSSSTLAYRLDETVNTAAPHLHAHWLAGVPSHLPLHFPKQKAGIIAEYIHSLPAYRAIFGDAQKPKHVPLAERADMILTSCGPEDRPLGYDADRWFDSTGISVRDARAFIAGDISGNLLGNSRAAGKAPPKVERKIAELNEAWLGAKLHHLRACARRALNEDLPGVVLCAIGANKAGTVREIVRLGLANRILLDGDCWAQLEAIL